MALALDGQTLTTAVGLRRLISAWGGNLIHVNSAIDVGCYAGSNDLDHVSAYNNNASNGYVDKLYDQSGHARDVPIAIASGLGYFLRFTIAADFNGKLAMGDPAQLDTANSPLGSALFTTAAGTLLYVGRHWATSTDNQASWAANNHLVGETGGNNPCGIIAYKNGLAATARNYFLAAYLQTAAGYKVAQLGSVDKWAYVRVAMKWDGANFKAKLNGGAWVTIAAGASLALAGRLQTVFNGGNANFVEIVASNTVLSDAAIGAWDAEAAAYWGPPGSVGMSRNLIGPHVGRVHA